MAEHDYECPRAWTDPDRPPRQRQSLAAGMEGTSFSKRDTKIRERFRTRQWTRTAACLRNAVAQTPRDESFIARARRREALCVWMEVVLNYLCFLS